MGFGSARIGLKICFLDPDLHGQMWIQDLKKPRKCTGSLGEYSTGRIKLKSKDPFVIFGV